MRGWAVGKVRGYAGRVGVRCGGGVRGFRKIVKSTQNTGHTDV